jgi:hypothetical protein
MNGSLIEGATDGKYKKIRPDSEGSPMNSESTYITRQALSLPYYGIGEPRMLEVPGQNSYTPKPWSQPNKLERLEDSSILGETW